jgi:alpha-amylase
MNNHYYYDDYENEFNIKRAAEMSFLPVNKIILDLVNSFNDAFSVSFLFSGVVLDKFKLYYPQILDDYKALIDTGSVHLLSGTYSNTFRLLSNNTLYKDQIKLQKERLRSLFGKDPIDFPDRNLRYFGIDNQGISILSGDRKLYNEIYRDFYFEDSDRIFNNPEKLIRALNSGAEENSFVDIFIPFYVSGDFEDTNSGLLKFLETFPSMVLSETRFTFANPSGTGDYLLHSLPFENISAIHYGNEDTFSKSYNEMQVDAFEMLYSLSEKMAICDDAVINKDWLYLQSCDHFNYMNPALYESKGTNRIFLPYDSHYFGYINFMNILTDFSDRLDKWLSDNGKDIKYTPNMWQKIPQAM